MITTRSRGALSRNGDVAMLVSVHLPKTAGSSFVSALEQYFGDHLLRDYDDLPMNRSTTRRNFSAIGKSLLPSKFNKQKEEIHCIHGHYMPVKYRFLTPSKSKIYVTWMRDPVERLASHYYYWRRTYHPDSAARVHRKVVEEDWSLERFCFSKEMRDTYAKFLWGFPARKFAFIGITEDFERELARFSGQILKDRLPVPSLNRNPSKDRRPYIDDPEFRADIERFHARDMQLYQYALQLRERQVPADAMV